MQGACGAVGLGLAQGSSSVRVRQGLLFPVMEPAPTVEDKRGIGIVLFRLVFYKPSAIPTRDVDRTPSDSMCRVLLHGWPNTPCSLRDGARNRQRSRNAEALSYCAIRCVERVGYLHDSPVWIQMHAYSCREVVGGLRESCWFWYRRP